jgi:hypothetical protein
MARHRETEAERLRRCRQVFARAVADGVSMAEAQRREQQDRWRAIDARLAEKRCGTAAPTSGVWWQQGQYA